MNKIVFAVLMVTLMDICWSGEYDPRSYRMPRKCKSQIYCSEPGDYYPHDIVKTALNTNKVRKIGHLTDWCVGRPEDPARQSECGIGQCGARIYYVKDLFNNTRVVLQSEEKGLEIKQLYDITKCETEGILTKTRHLSKRSLKNHVMTCKTTYSEYHFHVLKTTGNFGVELIKARLPVCCKCRLMKK